MPISTMPWRASAPQSITSSAPRNGPAGWSRSPAITSTRSHAGVAGERGRGSRRAPARSRNCAPRGAAPARSRPGAAAPPHRRLLRRPRRHRAEVDAGAGRRDRRQRRDLLGRRPRRLEREAAHQRRDRLDRIGPRLDLGCRVGSGELADRSTRAIRRAPSRLAVSLGPASRAHARRVALARERWSKRRHSLRREIT